MFVYCVLCLTRGRNAGFEQAIQAYAIHLLSLTYQKVPRSVLAEAINIEGLSLDKFLEQQVANCGWILEKSHGRDSSLSYQVMNLIILSLRRTLQIAFL
ncbi:eukaryotic translation initiation factor 3 subunit K-like [Populus alba x Populus x berolinensis]|nr:eukaryotic translation initiation factor 3 subunit K-like [Populus alba x Populus x berolinensis]